MKWRWQTGRRAGDLQLAYAQRCVQLERRIRLWVALGKADSFTICGNFRSRDDEGLRCEYEDGGRSSTRLSVHECHHPMGALRQAGTKPLTDSEEEFSNGRSMSCMICGARWQRSARTHLGTMNSIITGLPLRPFEIGMALPVPKGAQWSDEAVGHRLYCE